MLTVIPLPLVVEAPSLCAFHHLTGLPCPGCGLTRSLVATAHLQFGQAFAFHAFGPPLTATALAWSALAATGKLPVRWSAPALLTLGVGAAAWLGWAVARAV